MPQFGDRDHTTVMYADRKINQLLAERRAVFNQVSELTNRIKMQARQSLASYTRARCVRRVGPGGASSTEGVHRRARALDATRSDPHGPPVIRTGSSTPHVHAQRRR